MKDLCSSDIFKKAEKFVEERNLFSPVQKVIAAVSGGADSVFMLYFLHELKKKMGFSLSVCHFNHGLRKEADEEEKFVLKLASYFNLDFFSESADVSAYSEEKKISVEMAARELRHGFFKKLIKEKKGDLIALAHNLTDSVETFFLNIERGTGIRGLKGIQVKSDFIVRPILCLDKDEIRRTLEELDIPFKLDKSNFNTKIKRNKVRKVLLPCLKETFGKRANQSFANLFVNLENSLKAQEFLMESFLKDNTIVDDFGVRVKIDFLRTLPDYLFYDLMLFLFEKCLGSTYGISKRLLEDLFVFVSEKKSAMRKLFSDGSFFGVKTKENFFLVKKEFFEKKVINVEKTGNYPLPFGYSYVFEKVVPDNDFYNKNSFCFLNHSLFSSSLKIERLNFDSDYMVLNGKKVVGLNKFLKKKGLSKFERETVFCLKKENEVLFVPGVAISDNLKNFNKGESLIKVYMSDCLG